MRESIIDLKPLSEISTKENYARFLPRIYFVANCRAENVDHMRNDKPKSNPGHAEARGRASYY
jgi:hypothetical protein